MTKPIALLLLLLSAAALAEEVPEEHRALVRLYFANPENTPGLPAPFSYGLYDKECGSVHLSGVQVPVPGDLPCTPAAAGCVQLDIAPGVLKLAGKCSNDPKRCCMVNTDCTSMISTPYCTRVDDERLAEKLLALELADGPEQVTILVRGVRFHPAPSTPTPVP